MAFYETMATRKTWINNIGDLMRNKKVNPLKTDIHGKYIIILNTAAVKPLFC